MGAGEEVNRDQHTLLQPSSSFVSLAGDGSEFTALSLCISEELLRNTDTKAALLPPQKAVGTLEGICQY